MILDKHWWTTADGRLVPDGDPDAAILAYPRCTEIPDATAEKLGITDGDGQADGEADAKAAPAPANKARRPTRNK